MADYSEITTYIREIKRAAIDTFMREQGWLIDFEYSDRYALWGFIPSWYRRPDENGEGGGERIAVGSDSLVEGFNNIRARVDSATALWLDLPSGDAATTVSGTQAVALQFGAAASGGTVITDGEVSKSIDTISNTVVSNVRGSFKAPFLDKYDAQFSKIVGGLGAAAAILETAYAAEEAIWPAAKQDAADICDSVRNAFRLKAKQDAQEVRDIVLGVVTAVAGVVTTIASAGTALPIVTMAGYAKIAAGTVKSLSTAANISTDSYDSIMSSLETASQNLNSAISGQESALQEMLEAASGLIDSENANFNLDAYELRTFPMEDIISLDRSEADTVLLNMERIGEALSSAVTSLSTAPGSSFLRRASGVGLGSTGPYSALSGLHTQVANCLDLTRNEYGRGRELFDATVEDFFSTDDEVKQVTDALMRELETETTGL